jgi:nucleotide-binding universal stress UspA family protein
MTIRPIVVGYDGSDSARTATRWALDEGARTGHPVRLAYVFEWMPAGSWLGPGPGPWPDETARREVAAMLDDAVAEAAGSHPGVVVDGVVLDGPAAILLREQSERAALMVLGNRGLGGFTGLLAGSTTVTVCAHAHCPVVVVRAVDPAAGTRPGPVVVGVDGSDSSLLALEFAFSQAAHRGVPLLAIRGWSPPATPWVPPVLDPAEITRAEQAALDEVLTGWRAKYPDVEVRAEVRTAGPAADLIEASRSAQLVVVGSRGRGGFRGLLLGSVSQQLLHHAECPVAVVRELADPAPVDDDPAPGELAHDGPALVRPGTPTRPTAPEQP